MLGISRIIEYILFVLICRNTFLSDHFELLYGNFELV